MLAGNPQMFGVSGAGLASVRYLSNNHKRARRGLDIWDRQSKELFNVAKTMTYVTLVMDRDMRMTGVFRAQSDKPEAPLGFELNNPWKACHEAINKQTCSLTAVADGGRIS
jgi:hypothetical protein